MALVGALWLSLNAVLGSTNRSLRGPGEPTARPRPRRLRINPMSYDLGRLRLNGLKERVESTNHYRLTSDGQRVAICYTKLRQRLLRPLLAADTPPAPAQLRDALATIDHHPSGYITAARLGNAPPETQDQL